MLPCVSVGRPPIASMHSTRRLWVTNNPRAFPRSSDPVRDAGAEHEAVSAGREPGGRSISSPYFPPP